MLQDNADLLGFSVTAFAVAKMMGRQRAGDAVGCLFWQRIRIVSQALTISAVSMPLILPHLSSTSLLMRTTKTVNIHE